jgi:hypothetical protein
MIEYAHPYRADRVYKVPFTQLETKMKTNKKKSEMVAWLIWLGKKILTIRISLLYYQGVVYCSDKEFFIADEHGSRSLGVHPADESWLEVRAADVASSLEKSLVIRRGAEKFRVNRSGGEVSYEETDQAHWILNG